MNFKSGRLWPYAIGGAITIVFGFCVATVVVTSKADISESNLYMNSYHKVDAEANDIIEAQIAFNKKYKLQYITDTLDVNGATIKYKITDKNGKPVDNAKMKVIVSRADSKFEIDLNNPKVKDGIYTFKTIKLPKKGRWDVIAKVNIGNLYRFYNLKADTRMKEAFEY